MNYPYVVISGLLLIIINVGCAGIYSYRSNTNMSLVVWTSTRSPNKIHRLEIRNIKDLSEIVVNDDKLSKFMAGNTAMVELIQDNENKLFYFCVSDDNSGRVVNVKYMNESINVPSLLTDLNVQNFKYMGKRESGL